MEQVLLSIGHGYAAEYVARALGPGWRVLATTRSAERAETLAKAGREPVIWTAGQDGSALRMALEQATHLITSVPPDDAGDPVLRALTPLIADAERLKWIGYLSATSTYGDAQGGWVDERTPAAPGSARGRGRLAAERAWEALGKAAGVPVAILRIAGIYGPGRSAFDQLRRGTAHRIDKPGQVFSRIHVEDLGRIVAAAADQRAAGPFNLCDDEPAPPQDVVAYAAELAGLPCPPLVPFDTADLSPMARSFYSESKRTRSVRVGPELGVTLRHPDYRAGLRAILEGGG
ncbi:SDR family oxidoreductase [Pararhodobacter sp. SW119]|uniref:SDR family oxidoreductase n=1 Tax=Pararhodobacter sp. SW119 TaxID=2780075 RepID=UPI001ADF690D|nr:SDR family oxidoreductase [Pararhodobacter sp. SW119]